ncbi:putative permease [Lacticaseibacillus paracasei]|nr:putative permease [Lacticaseibacillus paracasei]
MLLGRSNMFDRLRHSKLMFWSVEILILIFVVIGLTQVSFLFAPVATFFSTLLIPILSAGFCFISSIRLLNYCRSSTSVAIFRFY